MAPHSRQHAIVREALGHKTQQRSAEEAGTMHVVHKKVAVALVWRYNETLGIILATGLMRLLVLLTQFAAVAIDALL